MPVLYKFMEMVNTVLPWNSKDDREKITNWKKQLHVKETRAEFFENYNALLDGRGKDMIITGRSPRFSTIQDLICNQGNILLFLTFSYISLHFLTMSYILKICLTSSIIIFITDY